VRRRDAHEGADAADPDEHGDEADDFGVDDHNNNADPQHLDIGLDDDDVITRQQRQPRDRSSEGDIGFSAPLFSRFVLVDVHIISPLTIGRIKDWASGSTKLLGPKSIAHHIRDGEIYKLRHYMRKAAEYLPHVGRDLASVSIDQDDPLACFLIETSPAVMTPWGNMSPQLLKLLNRLAEQQVSNETDDRILASAATNTAAGSVSDLIHRLRVRNVVNLYKGMLSCALARSLATTFSPAAQRVNVARQGRSRRAA
jgi:hypothetical protein